MDSAMRMDDVHEFMRKSALYPSNKVEQVTVTIKQPIK